MINLRVDKYNFPLNKNTLFIAKSWSNVGTGGRLSCMELRNAVVQASTGEGLDLSACVLGSLAEGNDIFFQERKFEGDDCWPRQRDCWEISR